MIHHTMYIAIITKINTLYLIKIKIHRIKLQKSISKQGKKLLG